MVHCPDESKVLSEKSKHYFLQNYHYFPNGEYCPVRSAGIIIHVPFYNMFLSNKN